MVGTGVKLFRAACDLDLEGIVAKRKTSIYDGGEVRSSAWVKIKNPAYGQLKGRRELFEQSRSRISPEQPDR